MIFSKRLFWLSAASLLLTAAAPAGASELRFSPADTMITSFDVFPVHVAVDAIAGIMGYNITATITGDPCVQVQDVVEGGLPGSDGDPTFFRWLNPGDAGAVTVNGSVLGTTVDGPGILFTIYLKALCPGTAWVDFGYSDLRNGVNVSIPHECAGPARIVIDEVIPVDESSWGAVKSLFRATR
ncbi:MAG: hypothetical protein PHQ19_05060 [Candidatus Krumholzibacteria bacterium]|nr:hypothetical protein [Candidatus Krumholzibacteria bacterium]